MVLFCVVAIEGSACSADLFSGGRVCCLTLEGLERFCSVAGCVELDAAAAVGGMGFFTPRIIVGGWVVDGVEEDVAGGRVGGLFICRGCAAGGEGRLVIKGALLAGGFFGGSSAWVRGSRGF